MVFSNALQSFQALVTHDLRLTVVLFLLGIPAFTFALTTLQSWSAIKSSKQGTRPVIVPYCIPFFGNMFAFLWDVPAFAHLLTKKFGFDTPLRIRIGPFKAYVISRASHFESILKGGKELTADHGLVHWLVNLFGLPKETAKLYYKDNSGISTTPAPGSDVSPHNRHFFLRRDAASRLLYGSHLSGMTTRFVDKLAQVIDDSLEVQHEWVDMPDLNDYLQKQIFQAATTALCGEYIFSLNPSFADDFWSYVDGLGVFFKGMPRWLNPRAYQARDKVIAAIKKWHTHAWQHTDKAKEEDYDPYFGAKIFKTRYKFMKAMDGMIDEAQAAEDLAFIFATNANAVPSAIWMLIEFLRDPELLQRVQNELDDSRIPSDTSIRFDIPKLCNGVLLQSVLHETLRLRIAVELIRIPERQDYKLGKWSIPKGGLMFLSSALAARNADLWNSERPLDKFWGDRFIIYPEKPSGPLKVPVRKVQKPEFSSEGLGGGFIPFGGGLRMCPGRFFAKNEILVTFAMLTANFDIELKMPSTWEPEPDLRFYGVGAMPPKGKIAFRIRRKKASSN